MAAAIALGEPTEDQRRLRREWDASHEREERALAQKRALADEWGRRMDLRERQLRILARLESLSEQIERCRPKIV